MFRMDNHTSNSLSSEQPLFENGEAIIKYVASFLLDYEENPKVDEEVVNRYANSLLVDSEENPEQQVNQVENGHTPSPTGSSFKPNKVEGSSNGESSMGGTWRPTTREVRYGSVILALPAKGNNMKTSRKNKNTELPRSFKISSLDIGSWKIKANDSVSLTATIQFGWQNLVWEIEKRGQKAQRIQFKWRDISAMKVLNEGEPSGIAIKLNKCPKFFRENGTHPITRRIEWVTTEDFTNGEAQCHWHIVKYAPDAVKEDIGKLLRADPRLSWSRTDDPNGPEGLLETQVTESTIYPSFRELV